MKRSPPFARSRRHFVLGLAASTMWGVPAISLGQGTATPWGWPTPYVKVSDKSIQWLKDKGETTLKRFYREKNRIRLQPANPTMLPIYAHPANVEVQGKVLVVIRQVA